MPCFHPIDAWQSKFKKDNGKSSVVFSYPVSNYANFESIKIPCGQCVGCRLERSRKWALRCMHEMQMHDRNCFITLTYNDSNLPDDRSLNIRDFQLFMKRLRKKFGKGIRFFHCGEYGERFARPHYHAILFGFDFDDKVPFKETECGDMLYVSADLDALWQKGFCTIGSANFATAAYVARYIMKKVNGDGADQHYFDSSTGVYLRPEYVTMSRRPGIAGTWYDRFESDVFPSDYLVVNGVKCKPPRYYDTKYEITNPDGYEFIKNSRKAEMLKHLDNNTPDRLKVREVVEKARLATLKRDGVD